MAPTIPPMPGESLLGLLVAVDRAYDLPLGSTAVSVCKYSPNTATWPPVTMASGSAYDLRRLATLTGQTSTDVRALTFLPALEALFGKQTVSIKKLGPVRVAVCPVCWRGKPAHLRVHLLPGVQMCPVHGTTLLEECACGARLSLRLGELGECPSCGADWSRLQAIESAEPVRRTQQRLLRIYEYLLGQPSGLGDRVPKAALVALRRRRVREGKTPLPVYLHSVSLAYLAAMLLALDADAELLETLLDRPATPCPNATCANFDAAFDDAVERHCPVCGTRFVGRRILSTFYVGHGQATPSRKRVVKAQRRVAGWRRELRLVTSEMLDSGERITMRNAFIRAGVPLNANLRAPRLGLTSIVRSAQRRAVSPDEPWAYGLQGAVRCAVARGDTAWLYRWLRDDARHPAIPADLLPAPRQDQWAWTSSLLVWE